MKNMNESWQSIESPQEGRQPGRRGRCSLRRVAVMAGAGLAIIAAGVLVAGALPDDDDKDDNKPAQAFIVILSGAAAAATASEGGCWFRRK